MPTNFAFYFFRMQVNSKRKTDDQDITDMKRYKLEDDPEIVSQDEMEAAAVALHYELTRENNKDSNGQNQDNQGGSNRNNDNNGDESGDLASIDNALLQRHQQQIFETDSSSQHGKSQGSGSIPGGAKSDNQNQNDLEGSDDQRQSQLRNLDFLNSSSIPLHLRTIPGPTAQHSVQAQQALAVVNHQNGNSGLGTFHTGDDHSQSKPAIGTEEWHRIRRDNHKEVERRRRENINTGINELAKIVPGCEKNKSQILRRAVEYIKQLKENENSNMEKWTLEKLLTEQTVNELSSSNEKLKTELEIAYREIENWKKIASSRTKEESKN